VGGQLQFFQCVDIQLACYAVSQFRADSGHLGEQILGRDFSLQSIENLAPAGTHECNDEVAQTFTDSRQFFDGFDSALRDKMCNGPVRIANSPCAVSICTGAVGVGTLDFQQLSDAIQYIRNFLIGGFVWHDTAFLLLRKSEIKKLKVAQILLQTSFVRFIQLRTICCTFDALHHQCRENHAGRLAAFLAVGFGQKL
jgi:hypothetical protein